MKTQRLEIKIENQFEHLRGDKAISIPDSDQFLISHTTFKVKEFLKTMEGLLGAPEKWFDEGVSCEIISPSKSWRKGKVKVCLEFYPDESKIPEIPERNEPENSQLKSSLDDIRQMKTRSSQ